MPKVESWATGADSIIIVHYVVIEWCLLESKARVVRADLAVDPAC